MSNNKEQPKTENLNNQFSNTELLTYAQRVAIANTMSNNKQSSLEMMWDEIDNLFPYKDTVELQKFCAILDKYKAMHKEEIKKSYTTGFGANLYQAENYYKETFGGNK